MRLAEAWSYIINLSYDFVCWYILFLFLYCSFGLLPPHAFLPFLYIISRRSSVCFSLSPHSRYIFPVSFVRKKRKTNNLNVLLLADAKKPSLRRKKKFNLFSFFFRHQQSHEITNLETFTQYLVSVQVFNPEVRKFETFDSFLGVLLQCKKFNLKSCHRERGAKIKWKLNWTFACKIRGIHKRKLLISRGIYWYKYICFIRSCSRNVLEKIPGKFCIDILL